MAKLPRLTLVYLEMNPWSENTNYRNIVIHTLTKLQRLDAEMCRLGKDIVGDEQEVKVVDTEQEIQAV